MAMVEHSDKQEVTSVCEFILASGHVSHPCGIVSMPNLNRLEKLKRSSCNRLPGFPTVGVVTCGWCLDKDGVPIPRKAAFYQG